MVNVIVAVEVPAVPFATPLASTNVADAVPAVTVGASFTGLTVILKVCTALVSTPPFLVPPLSLIFTETSAEPFAFNAGV